MDAVIAGTAIGSKAKLATDDHNDFAPFVSHGLELI